MIFDFPSSSSVSQGGMLDYTIASLCHETAALSPTVAKHWASILRGSNVISESLYERLFASAELGAQ